MFIEQAWRARHEFWRYLIGSLIIILFSLIGQIPLSLVILIKSSGFSESGPKAMQNLMQASDLSANAFTFLMLISFVFAFVGIFLVVRFLHRQSFKSVTTTRKKVDWKRIIFSFSLMAGFVILSTYIDYQTHPEDYAVHFRLVPFLILLVIGVFLIPIQTSVEEYVFRGYLMQGFGMLAQNRWFPLLMTSVIFGSLHIFNPEISQFGYGILAYYIGTGLFLGIMTLMDEGMELSLGFHAANNLVGALLVTADWSAFQTESVLKDLTHPSGVGLETFVPLLVIYPIFLLVMARKYHWKDWKNKLLGTIDPPSRANSPGDPVSSR